MNTVSYSNFVTETILFTEVWKYSDISVLSSLLVGVTSTWAYDAFYY